MSEPTPTPTAKPKIILRRKPENDGELWNFAVKQLKAAGLAGQTAAHTLVARGFAHPENLRGAVEEFFDIEEDYPTEAADGNTTN